jgi:cobalt/nickel transport system permease protein
MRLGLEEYARRDSSLHRWDPRYKLVGLMALIFAFSFVRDLRTLPLTLVAAAVLLAVSQLPVSFWLRRLRAPGIFILLTALLLPLTSGASVFVRLGPLTLRREGCMQAVLIVTKFITILTTSMVLFGTAPYLTTVNAMRALGLPSLLSDMTLFAYRYIHVVGEDFEAMDTAMGLRGFRSNRLGSRALAALSSLAGSLLVRSYERSERVHKAMILRGYGQRKRPRAEFQATRGDLFALALALLVAAGLATLDVVLRNAGG